MGIRAAPAPDGVVGVWLACDWRLLRRLHLFKLDACTEWPRRAPLFLGHPPRSQIHCEISWKIFPPSHAPYSNARVCDENTDIRPERGHNRPPDAQAGEMDGPPKEAHTDAYQVDTDAYEIDTHVNEVNTHAYETDTRAYELDAGAYTTYSRAYEPQSRA